MDGGIDSVTVERIGFSRPGFHFDNHFIQRKSQRKVTRAQPEATSPRIVTHPASTADKWRTSSSTSSSVATVAASYQLSRKYSMGFRESFEQGTGPPAFARL